MKTCRECGEEKPLDEFHRDRSTRDGKTRLCKECNRAKARQWTRDNAERSAERSRIWYLENRDEQREKVREYYWANREECIRKSVERNRTNPNRREITRRYYEKNKDKIREKSKAHWEANREQYRENQRRWKKANPAKVRANNYAHQTTQTAPGNVEYIEVLLKDPCCYCGSPTEQIDHIEPVSRGGANHWSNLTAACKVCNVGKNARPMLHFMLA